MKKACPVVLRKINDLKEILVFSHPLAGIQLAKGTVEPSELGKSAAERELYEESGVQLKAEYLLAEWQRLPTEPVWEIYLMESGNGLPDCWDHYCKDDGGHAFSYFWHSLDEAPSQEWHGLFVDALGVIKYAIYCKK